MPRKCLLSFLFLLFFSLGVEAQQPPKANTVDTSFTDYDQLFSELESFIDSLLTPRSFTVFSVGISNGYFNYESKSDYSLKAVKKAILSPSLAYYSKTGLGISGTVTSINENNSLLPYQIYLTGSYDYIKNRKFITGLSLTHFFTKDSLDFYTSPLSNEAYVFFTYRNFWIKPTVAFSYGWGSRSGYQEREEYINSLLLRPTGYTRINTMESITDVNLTLSLRHDFFWLNVLSKRDYIRLTPQLVFTSGTQQFGFNQTSNTYGKSRITGTNVLYNSEEVFLDNSLYFQPLSLSANIKTEYSKGKFFLQPQFLLGYYFPSKEGNLSSAFQLNAGVIF